MSKKFGIQTKGTGRAVMQAGGMAPVGGAARRDMRSGYYPNDMGMRGGAMYNKGGRVGLRDRAFKKGGRVKAKEGFFAKEDESIGERLGKGKATAKDPKKAKKERDLSYGKWDKRAKDWKKTKKA